MVPEMPLPTCYIQFLLAFGVNSDAPCDYSNIKEHWSNRYPKHTVKILLLVKSDKNLHFDIAPFPPLFFLMLKARTKKKLRLFFLINI